MTLKLADNLFYLKKWFFKTCVYNFLQFLHLEIFYTFLLLLFNCYKIIKNYSMSFKFKIIKYYIILIIAAINKKFLIDKINSLIY